MKNIATGNDGQNKVRSDPNLATPNKNTQKAPSSGSHKSKGPAISEVAGKYRIARKLGAGSFGEVYLGSDKESGTEVAIKMEDAKSAYPQLFYEAKLLGQLKGGQGITHVHHVGTEKGYNVLVMELLGPSLEDLLNLCKGRFSKKTTLMLAEQLLRRIEYVHSKGYMHRDIKPENFVVGRQDRTNKVYVIDFGLSKRYCDAKTKEHIAYKEGRDLTGTARYASVNAHRGIEQSRRDDLEAIGYMLMYFLRGNLPWQGLPAKTKSEKYRKIKETKASTPLNDLCKGHPTEFWEYLKYCRNLGFKDKPDYAYLRQLMRDGIKREQLGEVDWHFDWSKGQARPLTPEEDAMDEKEAWRIYLRCRSWWERHGCQRWGAGGPAGSGGRISKEGLFLLHRPVKRRETRACLFLLH